MSGEERNGEDEQGTLVSRKEIIWSGWERTWMWMWVRACGCMGVCRRGRMEKQVAWRNGPLRTGTDAAGWSAESDLKGHSGCSHPHPI